MNDFEKSILKIISEIPGLKAKDIAEKLKCERKEINSALYGILKGYCYQDSRYQWYLNTQKNTTNPVESSIPPDKLLANICKYYLNCLSLEESNGISTFLRSNSSLNYAELSTIYIDSSNEKVVHLIRKISAEKNLTANVGYPVLIEKIHSIKTNQDYLKVAPVFLFPLKFQLALFPYLLYHA